MRHRAPLALLLATAALLCACTQTIHGPTTFAFEGLTDRDAQVVGRTLKSIPVAYSMQRKGDTTYFHTKGIRTTDQLGEVYDRVNALRRRRGIEFEFSGLTLGYTSLTASGSASTSVKIEMSPGAMAFVADQRGSSAWRQIRLDSRGKWSGPVLTNGRVSESGGWLYVAFTRDGELYRFLRVNVLTGQQQPTTLAQVKSIGLKQPRPGDAADRQASSGRTSTTSPASSTKKAGWSFKWPWE